MEEEKKELTPELEEELARLKGFTDDSTFLYVPKLYRENEKAVPRDQWPIFKLKGRDGLDFAKAEDSMGFDTRGQKMFSNSGSLRIKILRTHILGWKNWKDRNENEIRFMGGTDGVANKLIAKMPNSLQVELLEAVSFHSRLTEEELAGLEF